MPDKSPETDAQKAEPHYCYRCCEFVLPEHQGVEDCITGLSQRLSRLEADHVPKTPLARAHEAIDRLCISIDYPVGEHGWRGCYICKEANAALERLAAYEGAKKMSELKSGMLLSEEEICEAARLAGIDADKVIGYPSGMEPFELAFARRIEAAVLTKWAHDLVTARANALLGGVDTGAIHTVGAFHRIGKAMLEAAAEAEKESNGD